MEDFTTLPPYERQNVIKEVKDRNVLLPSKVVPVLTTAAEVICLIALSALGTLIQFDFVLNAINWVEFATFLSMRLIMQFLGSDTTARARVEIGQTEQEHVELKDRLKKAGENVSFTELDNYLNAVENPRRKIEAWKQKQQGKCAKVTERINRLELQIKVAALRPGSGAVKVLISKRKRNKIACLKAKREAIMATLTDEYIAENYDVLPVKYKPLTVEQFFTVEMVDEKSERYYIDTETENKKQIAKGIPFSILLSTLATVIGLSGIRFNTINVVLLIYDILCVVMRLALGWFYIGKKTVAAQRQVIISKRAFLERFKSRKVG